MLPFALIVIGNSPPIKIPQNNLIQSLWSISIFGLFLVVNRLLANELKKSICLNAHYVRSEF